MRSWAVGTAGLTLLLVVAVAVSRARPPRPTGGSRGRRVLAAGLLAVGIQGLHFLEELSAGFHEWFPTLLGLAPWSRGAFAAFNLAWMVLWGSSLWLLARGRPVLVWPLWFLGLALVANAFAHPLLAVLSGGYVPGLASALPAGLAGGWLLLWLWRLGAPAGPAAPDPPGPGAADRPSAS